MHDVAAAIQYLVNHGPQPERAFNISQDETLSLAEFIGIMAKIMDKSMPQLVEFQRAVLEANGFLPDCSPFSDLWMSELTNERSKTALAMRYTPLSDYLRRIILSYSDNPPARPASYGRRNAERQLTP
jgi:nucleoside-diphosphate-sugar epimerase